MDELCVVGPGAKPLRPLTNGGAHPRSPSIAARPNQAVSQPFAPLPITGPWTLTPIYDIFLAASTRPRPITALYGPPSILHRQQLHDMTPLSTLATLSMPAGGPRRGGLPSNLFGLCYRLLTIPYCEQPHGQKQLQVRPTPQRRGPSREPEHPPSIRPANRRVASHSDCAQ